jgi:hypothetical protein
VNAHTAEARDDTQLASDRREGRCLVSYAAPGGWVTISKAILTDVLGAGRDAAIVLPPAAARSLQLMCPSLVILPSEASGHTETIPT